MIADTGTRLCTGFEIPVSGLSSGTRLVNAGICLSFVLSLAIPTVTLGDDANSLATPPPLDRRSIAASIVAMECRRRLSRP